jgi:hypothetical protein
MLCTICVGLNSGSPPYRGAPRVRVGTVAAFGAHAGCAGQARMNLSSWQFTALTISAKDRLWWHPGLSFPRVPCSFVAFYLATSPIHDAIPAAATCLVLLLASPSPKAVRVEAEDPPTCRK